MRELPKVKLCLPPVKPMPTCLLLSICLFSLPFYQPRLDRTLHFIDLVPSLKNHTLSSTLTFGTLDLNWSHPPSTANPRKHHSTMVFSLSSHFLSNPNQPPPPHLFLCLIFVLFDLWFCCFGAGVGGGVLVVFVCCGWWCFGRFCVGVVDIMWVVMSFVWVVVAVFFLFPV